MPTSWQALHAELLRSVSTHASHHRFKILADRFSALRGFPDSFALLEHQHQHQHRLEGDRDARAAVIRALVIGARAMHPEADTVLLLALWPGLDAIYRRNLRFFHSCPENLVSEIMARIVGGIHALDLDRVTAVAATLLRNVERDLRRTQIRERVLTTRHDPIDTVPEPAAVQPEAASLGMLVARLPEHVGRDAELVLRVAVLGETQKEAAVAIGIAPAAARKRYRRALGRLRPVLADIL